MQGGRDQGRHTGILAQRRQKTPGETRLGQSFWQIITDMAAAGREKRQTNRIWAKITRDVGDARGLVDKACLCEPDACAVQLADHSIGDVGRGGAAE